MSESETFLYFAYGSNLLTKRIRMNNPTAVRKYIGKVTGYRLDFGYWANRWNGSVATIAPDDDSDVWGCVWELNKSDIKNLDKQEGVQLGIYKAINVTVKVADTLEEKVCRCYQLIKQPDKIQPGSPVPDNRKPSRLYWSILLEGAQECKLPSDYIASLKIIPHNDWNEDSHLQRIMLIDD